MKTCNHLHTKTTLTPELKHHARKDCLDCGSFVAWLPKPESLEREKKNQANLLALQNRGLNEWEKGFVLSLLKQGRHFSPKQQARLDEMISKHLVAS